MTERRYENQNKTLANAVLKRLYVIHINKLTLLANFGPTNCNLSEAVGLNFMNNRTFLLCPSLLVLLLLSSSNKESGLETSLSKEEFL